MKSELQHRREQTEKHLQELTGAVPSQGIKLDQNLAQIQKEQERVTNIAKAPHVLIKNIDAQFEKATKLTKTDIVFLFVAVGLQCLRQYLLTLPSERLGDKEAAHEVKEIKESSDRSHRLYNPSLDEIVSNPVPFDASMGAKQYGALSGYGALGHRGATPGHDPLAGLIFGTANIATSTLTNWSMDSYHIYTGTFGNAAGVHDIFRSRANTGRVLSETFINKLLYQGMDGKIIVGTSVCKEIIHLRSDIYSKDSLPLPLVSTISPQLAGNLAKRGLDMANVLNVGKQFTYAVAIDTLISIIHSLFFDEKDGISRDAYEIRTRRVLMYSNIIATTSNVVVAALAQYATGTGSRIADWGGYINTVRHIVFDTQKINEIKKDFLKNELYKQVVGPQYDFMEGL